MAYTKYSLTPSNNTATPPDGAPEGMLPSAVNDTMRDMMAQIRDCGDGIRDGTYTMTAAKITGGTITGVAFTGNTFTSPVISGGSINNTTIGASTANTGKFTTLEATGVTTVQAGTVSAPAITTTGDTNTGIYFPAADTIAFTEGGVEAMRIDSSGNVGIGITPSTWTILPALEIKNKGNALFSNGTNDLWMTSNLVYNSGWIYGSTNTATGYEQTAGAHIWFNSPSGTAGTTATLTERMRIDSSGNVSVGTSTGNPLGNGGTVTTLAVSGGSGYGSLSLVSTATADGSILGALNFGSSSSSGSKAAAGINGYLEGSGVTNASGNLRFFTRNGADFPERMRIDSSGNVGIGTSSPSSFLADGNKLVVGTGSGGNGLSIYSGSSSLGRIAFADGTAGSEPYAGLIDYSHSDNSMRFSTNGGSERMRIDSSGNLLVGTTSTGGKIYSLTSTNQYALYGEATSASLATGVLALVAARNTTNNTFKAIVYYNSGAAADKFVVADSGNVTNTNGSYGTISDQKLKENIVDATPKLDKVNQLKVRNYNFIGDNLKQIGFVAQELENVFPGMVETSPDTDKDGNDLGTTTKTIKTTVLIPILVKAIQEQQQIINDLKARIETLESK
jgi:hypothetical protein